jgi:hypothetical protein
MKHLLRNAILTVHKVVFKKVCKLRLFTLLHFLLMETMKWVLLLTSTVVSPIFI